MDGDGDPLPPNAVFPSSTSPSSSITIRWVAGHGVVHPRKDVDDGLGHGGRSTGQSSGQNGDDSPDAAQHKGQSCALLDPTILEEDPSADSTAFAVCTASDNQQVRVSLRLVKPPSTSYLQLRTDAQVHVKPTLLSADAHLLLIHMVVATIRDPPFTSYEDNLFVYKCLPDEPSLHLLPQIPFHAAPVWHTGITCRGGNHLVIAGFHTSVTSNDDEVGLLSLFSSSTRKWEVLDLSIPFDPVKGLYKFVWGTDDKFALHGFMFWVDYHRGMYIATCLPIHQSLDSYSFLELIFGTNIMTTARAASYQRMMGCLELPRLLVSR